MGLPDYLRDQLLADETLAALGIADPPQIRRSVPDDVPPEELWITFRWGVESPFAFSDTDVRPMDLGVWAYDRQLSYGRITPILNRIRVVLTGLRAVRHTDVPEGWITEVRWEGRSPDLSDDVYKAVTRNDSYRIVAS